MGDGARDTAPGEIIRLDDVETLDSAATERLLALAREGATGELVCSCVGGRMQACLQRGRIAWASDPRHPRAFTAHLKQHAGLRAADVEAVVAECLTTKRPIGEALIAHGLATEAQVRAALRHQIALALHVGSCPGPGEAVFARRHWAEYDERFTFGASELIEEEERAARAAASRKDGP
jgi:hypothetical protein